ncbi:MAG: Sporulation related domain protein [Bacteroidetes bacterium ADurb.Bin408]|nr:MAG: Sporulation related domain protein [Bacteroidetes bacterium ADurb.Bin408]
MKFETGRLRMEVAVRTQVIPEKEKTGVQSPPEVELNTLAEFQEKLIAEKTKINEVTQTAPENKVTVIVNNNQPEVKNTIPDEEIKNKTNDIVKKSDDAVKVFEVKADKLYNYAEQKSNVSKMGIAQADKILQNARNMTDAALKNKEIEKANQLYEKSFEQAQEALAAVNLAKQFDEKAKEIAGKKEQLKNDLDEYKKLAESGKIQDAENLIQKLNTDYDTEKIEEAFKNQVSKATENSLNNKQREAQDLLNQSKKQYDEAVKLKEEAKQLYEQARNTPDVNQKNKLVSNAEQKEKQANAAKQLADDNFNKAEKIKIEVGVLKMKVEFTVSVEEMPLPQTGTPDNKNAVLADVVKLEEKINTHNFSDAGTDNKRFEEVVVKPVATQNTNVSNPPVRIDVTQINNVQQLEAEVKKNSQLAAQEKQIADATSDINQRLDIQSRAEVYEQNANDAKIKLYDLKADNNNKLVNSNKATLQEVKVDNNNDENARKARMLEDEAAIYLQKAEQRKNEARNSPVAALKPNLLEDAVRNQELALQKQNEAIAYYKKAQPPATQLVTQNTNPNNNNAIANTRPVTNNNQNQTAQNNPQVNQNNNTRPVQNNQQPRVQQNMQDDGKLISDIKGLFFTVQVGVFGASRTSAQLLNLSPLYYDKLNNGFYRYFAGIFSSREGAVALKNDVVSKGIPDAFVVAFNNGTRIPVNDAVDLLQSGKAQLQNQLTFNTPPAVTGNVNAPAQTGNGLYYAVQIGVYKQQRSSAQLFNIAPISYESIAGGLIRHLTGNFTKRRDADNLKNDIVRKGIDDAFVVAYHNGRRITLAEARNLEGGAPVAVNNVPPNNAKTPNTVNQNQANQTNVQPNNQLPAVTTPVYKAEDIRFRVQIGAFKEAVSSLILSQYKNLLGEDIDAIKTDAGLTLYLVGSFKDFLEASALRNKIVNKGIADAFVVAYHKKERIPLNVARELLK